MDLVRLINVRQLLLPHRTKSESNITTFEGRQTTFLQFQLSNKLQSNLAPAPLIYTPCEKSQETY